MSTPQKKTILVIGATGNQGSSVAHTFLSLPSWHVRCLTRNPSSPAAQSLLHAGAELVQADLSDPTTLPPAFASVHAIFANTDFWTTFRHPDTAARASAANTTPNQLAYDTEVAQGSAIADAASRTPTLERFIYSSLPPAKAASHGKYPHSTHWESKAAIVSYISTTHPALAAKMSLIYLGAYNTNALLFPRWDDASGKYLLVMPMKPSTLMPIVDAPASTGVFVRALVEDEEPGTKLLAYDSDSHLPMTEVVETWSRVVGKEAELVEVTAQLMHEQLKIPMELLDGAGFISEFHYMYGVDGSIEPPQLKCRPQTRSWEEWLRSMEYKEVREEGKVEMVSTAKGEEA